MIRRDGFGSLAEAEEWVDGLRILMAALGAPVAQETDTERPAFETAPVEPPRSGQLRTVR